MGLKEALDLGKLVGKSRWFVLFVSFLVISFSGATYIFGLYSPAIKKSLGYNQKTLNTLAFFKDLGANVGIVPGLLNEFCPAWFVLGVGGLMNLTGFMLVWLSVTGRVARPQKWQMFTYMTIGCNSQTFTNTGALVTCVKNFPQSRGIVLGILKGFAGLSGAIFTQIYHALYGNDPSKLILLIGWLPCLVCLTVMFAVRPMSPDPEEKELGRFYSFLTIALLLAGFLMVVIIVQNHVKFPAVGYKLVAAGVVFFLLLPLLVVVKAEMDRSDSKKYPILELSELEKNSKPAPIQYPDPAKAIPHENKEAHNSKPAPIQHPNPAKSQLHVDQEAHNSKPDPMQNPVPAKSLPHEDKEAHNPKPGLIQDPDPAKSQLHEDKEAHNSKPGPTQDPDPVKYQIHEDKEAHNSRWWFKLPKRGEDYTIPQAMVSIDMWILFIATTCGIGAALTAIDNMGQIGSALGFSQVDVSTFVSLISIWNFLGRVMSGFCSEILLRKYGFPRPAILASVLALACVGHLCIAFAVPGSLYVASVVLGFCFGAQWPVIFAMISEFFGLKYYSTLYNLAGSASPLGSYLLSVRVAGYLYDLETMKQHAALHYNNTTGSAHPPLPANADELVCKGVTCFRLTFIIMSCVSLFGAAVSGILVLRTRDFYKGDLYAKYQDQSPEPQDTQNGQEIRPQSL